MINNSHTIKEKDFKNHGNESHVTPLVRTHDLAIGYRRKKQHKIVARHIDIALHPGELVCLLGPNGSGKSTLMRTLAGIQPSLSGEVHLKNHPIKAYNQKRLSKELSLVLTERQQTGNLSVYSILTLGRYPYLNWLGQLQEKDKNIIKWAIRETGIAPFINSHIDKLSDGEKQKVMIARALIQETPVIILDEPTAHLDLPNRIGIIRLLKKMARDTGKAILLSTHELDLALQAADAIWLIMPDQSLTTGVPEDLVLNGTFASAFRKEGLQFDDQTGSFKFHEWDGKKTVALHGGKATRIWTVRALEREGYAIASKGDFNIVIRENGADTIWHIEYEDRAYEFSLLEHVIQFLRHPEHREIAENNSIYSTKTLAWEKI
ncbi:ABC transporter ATP-binding protein [Fulvivirga sp. M361]|uniref:ABC transporter ATP-binding protein n=1 Tax=Fulvivirga sp. M361 TaxID=2594266 RepID=UPI00117B1254|nr:ABC transporter ATP-binding protein [Fulvivirga sp. M361]TRX62750.1 ABC transporter ATP-binding protein [Fulvivirga sp. M361]